MIDVAIQSSRVITNSGIRKANVLLYDGKIAGIEEQLPQGSFPVIDVGNKVVMAGIVDPHVHINEPGRTEWEGFDTATRAAIAGGVTTLVEMPLNASPVTTTVSAYKLKIKAAEKNLHTNCGFWGGIIPGNEKEIEPLAAAGVLGFKAFLTDSGIDEFPPVSEADLHKAMPLIARHGLPLLIHCELSGRLSPALSSDATRLRSYQHYLQSRPGKWEDDAIALAIRLCEKYNCRTHIVHLSSASSIPQIIEAKKNKLPLTVETCQHYLYFNDNDIADGQTQFKCAPPIRNRENKKQLWQALKNGVIDFVATDHSPAPPEMKELSSGNFMKAWGGIASLQFSLPALWTPAMKQGCAIEDLARWLSEHPAKLAGVEDRKGMIKRGYDADLVIWDPDDRFVVKENMILHKHPLTPYLQEELTGVISQTWLNGQQVYDEGKFLNLNRGKLIKGD